MENKSSTGPAIAAILLVGLLLCAYGGAYFWLGDVDEVFLPDDPIPTRFRFYDSKWMAIGFEPLGHIESAVTGDVVIITSDN